MNIAKEKKRSLLLLKTKISLYIEIFVFLEQQ
jgi:hypothetical protein